MVLQEKYRKSPEAVVSYDYFDYSNGTGYDVYYGAKGDNSEYFLTTRQIPSEEIASYLQDQSVATVATKYFDLDFDIMFNTPKNVKGNFLVSVPQGISATNATAADFQFYTIVKIIHYDGSTETQIGTGTSITSIATDLQTDGILAAARTNLIKANVSTIKHFKRGEILRITIEGWYKTTEAGATTAHLIIGHDPAGRVFNADLPEEPSINLAELFLGNGLLATFTNLSTILQVHVPFVISI